MDGTERICTKMTFTTDIYENSSINRKNTFVAFPWVETSTGPGGFMICVCVFFYYMTGTPEGSTESGFMEKPGIEPATQYQSSGAN